MTAFYLGLAASVITVFVFITGIGDVSQLVGKPLTFGARFETLSCGAIVDYKTGLDWFIGPDRETEWKDAEAWTNNLMACGGRWRMPTIEELQTLFDSAKRAGMGLSEVVDLGMPNKPSAFFSVAHMDPVFNGIGGGYRVWSGEMAIYQQWLTNDPPQVLPRIIDFETGKDGNSPFEQLPRGRRAFAVRYHAPH